MNIFDKWHKIDGTKIEDLEDYIRTEAAKVYSEKLTIMIGTDSNIRHKRKQNQRTINFMTIIAFKRGNNGAHLIKRRDEEVKSHYISMDMKLNGEIQRTSELALWIRDVINIDVEVHLDLNPSELEGSHRIYKYIKGYFESLGFKTLYKPEAQVSLASDYYL
jgi:predicted RNase H-related nuclease YkuK (DUF458 family)